MICNHDCSLYYFKYDEDTFWCVKCELCNKRSTYGDTEESAIIRWNNNGLTAESEISAGIFVKKLKQECSHTLYNCLTFKGGCFCYCLNCFAQTPVVQDSLMAEMLWHKNCIVKFDYEFLQYHSLIKRILIYVNQNIRYVDSMLGVVASKYRKKNPGLLNDICRRITVSLKACTRGLNNTIAVPVPVENLESKTVAVKINKIDFGKLTVL